MTNFTGVFRFVDPDGCRFGEHSHRVNFEADSMVAAYAAIRAPSGSLRLKIEAIMTAAGYNPRTAWHTYQGLCVEWVNLPPPIRDSSRTGEDLPDPLPDPEPESAPVPEEATVKAGSGPSWWNALSAVLSLTILIGGCCGISSCVINMENERDCQEADRLTIVLDDNDSEFKVLYTSPDTRVNGRLLHAMTVVEGVKYGQRITVPTRRAHPAPGEVWTVTVDRDVIEYVFVQKVR